MFVRCKGTYAYSVLYVSIKLRNQVIWDLYVNQTFYSPISQSMSTLADAFMTEDFIQKLALGFVPQIVMDPNLYVGPHIGELL